MKKIWLGFVVFLICCGPAKAIYGPSLARVKLPVAEQACREARFSKDEQIINAIHRGDPAKIAGVLGDALQELRATPVSSALYAARAFCVHELVPRRLPRQRSISSADALRPTAAVLRFRNLGIGYFYYDPDDEWVLRENPVDLNDLAAKRLDSRWGRMAFLTMIRLGWSQGECQEGPDQFREVIVHGEAFLKSYPSSEVSDDVRLELAHAYETWWNLSRRRADDSDNQAEHYRPGADAARRKAIEFYRAYLDKHPAVPDVRTRLAALQHSAAGSDHYDYFCPDYED